jgi:hypothetical protein
LISPMRFRKSVFICITHGSLILPLSSGLCATSVA